MIFTSDPAAFLAQHRLAGAPGCITVEPDGSWRHLLRSDEFAADGKGQKAQAVQPDPWRPAYGQVGRYVFEMRLPASWPWGSGQGCQVAQWKGGDGAPSAALHVRGGRWSLAAEGTGPLAEPICCPEIWHRWAFEIRWVMPGSSDPDGYWIAKLDDQEVARLKPWRGGKDPDHVPGLWLGPYDGFQRVARHELQVRMLWTRNLHYEVIG